MYPAYQVKVQSVVETQARSGFTVPNCNIMNWTELSRLMKTHHKASKSCFTFLIPLVCSWCGGGGQHKQFDRCCHAGGHLSVWSHHGNHRPVVVRALSLPSLHHVQEEAERQRAHHAGCDLHSCYEGHCWLHLCRYITGWLGESAPSFLTYTAPGMLGHELLNVTCLSLMLYCLV